MDDFATGAGATFGLSASAPATYNQAGYEALTFTTVGKVTNFGNIPSRVYEVVRQQYLASRGTAKAKGAYDLGSQQITVTIDPDDAGQALVATATNAETPYSVKMDHPLLGTIYARAIVLGGQKSWGDNNTPATQQITLEYTMATATNDGIVTVAAA